MLAPVKIAVCVKEVPDAAAPKRLDPRTFRLDRGGATALNEFDTHALEEGLRLKDAGGAEEVVAILMGPERAADSLRKALAMGADRSVLIADDALAGSDLVATRSDPASASSAIRTDLSAPMASALRSESAARSGPMRIATTSSAPPASLRRSPSSRAWVSNSLSAA